MGARSPPPPPSPLPSARCGERGAREAPVTAARASAASSRVRGGSGGGGQERPGTARRLLRRVWLRDGCGDDAGEWEGVAFASSPSRPGAALTGGGTALPFSCGAAGGGWSARRRRRRHPRLCPGQPEQRATVLRRRRRAPRRGWGRPSPPSLASGGRDLLPLLPSARGCRAVPLCLSSSPPYVFCPPSRSRRCTGADRSRAASPRALPSPLPDGGSFPASRRPPAPAAVSVGGSGERRFRRREERCWPPRPGVRRGWVFCVSGCAWGGWGGVCLFVLGCFFSLPNTRLFAGRVRGRVNPSRGRRLRPWGRLSGEGRRQLHFSL